MSDRVPLLVDMRFSPHAIDRMVEMNLDAKAIRDIVVEPEVVLPANQTRDKYGAAIPGGHPTRRMYRKGPVAVVADIGSLPDRLVIITVLRRTTDLYQRAM